MVRIVGLCNKFVVIIEIVFISEHPSGTWDRLFGAFLLDLCYHICLTF